MNKKKQLLSIFLISLVLLGAVTVLVVPKESRALSLDEISDIQQDIKNQAWGSLTGSILDTATSPLTPGFYATDVFGGAYNWVMDGITGLLDSDTPTQNTATIYDYANYMSQDSENILTVQSSHIKDVRNLVWSEVKYSTIQNLNNGTSRTTMKIKARQSVEDVYSRIEKNLVLQLSQQIKTLKHLEELNNNRSTELDNIAHIQARHIYYSWGNRHSNSYSRDIDSNDFYQRNVTLLNGSNVSVWDIEDLQFPKRSYSHGDGSFDVAPYPDENAYSGDLAPGSWVELRHKSFATASEFEIWDPTDVYRQNNENTNWNDVFGLISSENTMMKDNAEVFVNETYNEYQTGDLNISNIIDPSVLMSQMSSNFNTTGYYGYAGTQLAMMGINSSIQNRFTIHVYESDTVPTWEGKNITGMMFTDHKFENNTLRKGIVYNTSSWEKDELCYMVTGTGIHRLHTSFEIVNITNYRTGESLANVTFEQYNHQTLNTTNLSKQFEGLMKIYNTSENLSGTTPGTEGPEDSTSLGDLGSWFTSTYWNIPIWLWLVAIGFGFVAVRNYTRYGAGGSGNSNNKKRGK
ncbi:hypothetical protein C9439_02205 [archaeon SCG-AAA382B04]|nr:hypothetical protein C9439_02205 [archaeon SCG-AAA382B04]